jgi:hypothetical protein
MRMTTKLPVRRRQEPTFEEPQMRNRIERRIPLGSVGPGPMNRGMHAIAAAMDDEPCRSEPGRTRDAYDTAQWRTRRAQHGGNNATELGARRCMFSRTDARP